MVYETQNYRSFLKATLAEKIQSNPQFSLRAFALHLGLSHAALSQVFKGTKNLSYDRALDIATRLKLSDAEKEYFCTLVQYESAKSSQLKSELLDKLNRIRPLHQVHHLSLDKFKLIADWYHLPILNMTYIKDFNFNAKTVALRLGITTNEAEVAIERLERLGMLSKDETGRLVKTEERFLASSDDMSAALRKFHRQFLEKAIDALENQTTAEKINGSETFAFNQQKIARAKEITEDFYNKILALAGEDDDGGPTDVYHLQVNCFNLTKTEKTKPLKDMQ